ncbi:MAG: D-hexose-6-phosphate mutarotase [Betaproteobacteria bacterium]
MTPFEATTVHGLEALRITAPGGATALVTHHGAHVLSWVPAAGDERLYLSERAVYASGKAIRGGIPVIFPQFGTLGPLTRHGFARILPWTLDTTREGEDYALATWRLDSDAATRAEWPHEFRAELTVNVGSAQLDVELDIENTGGDSFAFTAALHTYLRVREIENALVTGLENTKYRDQREGGAKRTETGETFSLEGPVDRIHVDVPPRLILSESGRQTLIESSGFPDVVIWNPWEAGNAATADMAALDFRRMLCVEAAAVATPVALAAGAEWFGRQSLMVF